MANYIEILKANNQEHLLNYLEMADETKKNELIKEIEGIDFDLLNDDSKSILQEYIDSGKYILDFDEEDRRRIMSEFEYAFEKQNEHDAQLVAPPPFEASE